MNKRFDDFLAHIGNCMRIGLASKRFIIWTIAGMVVLYLSSGRLYARQALEPQATESGAGTNTCDGNGENQQDQAKAVVPFEMLPTNHMLVQVRINDKGPYRLIFDLGAPITLLNNRASESSDVVKPNAPRSFLFGLRGEAEINNLEVGELTVAKLPVIILDHPVLKVLEQATGHQIDGLIGFTFFARYKTTIDYHAHQMTFEPIDYQVRDLMKELPERLMGPKVIRHRVLACSVVGGCS